MKKTQRTKKQLIFPVLVIILALAAATVLVFQANAFMTTRQNTTRLDRINAIISKPAAVCFSDVVVGDLNSSQVGFDDI